MNLSRGDSSDSGLAGSSVSSRSDETDLTSPTDSPSPDGPSAFAPPLDDRHNKRASAFELQDREHLPPLDTRSGLDGNNATENVDHGQSPSGSLPTQGLAHDHSTSSSRTLALFGLWGEKWRKWLIFHVVVAIAFNGLALALAVYSSFWGDSAVKRQLSKMQKVLGSKVEDIGGCTDAAREELLALAKWNSFNNWIISCAQYAKQNITSGRCKGALEAFDTPPPYLPTGHASNLTRRSLDDLAMSLRNATSLTPSTTGSAHLDPQYRFILYLIASTCILTVLLLIIPFHQHVLKFFLGHSQRLVTERRLTFEQENEKSATFKHAQLIEIKPMETDNPNTSIRRRKLETSRQAQKRDIWTAASQGNVGAVEGFYLRNEAPEITSIHPVYGSLLHAAAQSGCAELVPYFLKKKANPNAQGGRFHSPLQAAASSGSLNLVKSLLNSGASIHAYGGDYGSPLHAAAEKGSFEMVQMLLDAGSDPNVSGGQFTFPLHAAAHRGSETMALTLLRHGADVNAAGEQFLSALHAATVEGQLNVVKVLLHHEADVNLYDSTQRSPLQIACHEGHSAIAYLLVLRGADVHVTAQDKQTPLHFAARCGHVELAEALIERGSSVNEQDTNGWTPLHHCALNGHDSLIELLISQGADVCAEDKFKAHPLFRSAALHHARASALLLAAGSPPDAKDCFGRTALHGPAADNDVSVQQLLINYGADVNATGDDKKTPLHEAANVGNVANVKLLLEQPGIRTSLQDNDQKIPLHRALDHIGSSQENGNESSAYEEIALALLDAPDLDIDACLGLALQEALARSQPLLATKILDRNASVLLSGGKYGGVVQAAVRSGSTDLLALVLSRGANINAHGGEYGTALQAAAFLGNIDMMDILLENGANVNAKGGKFGCPLNAARLSSQGSGTVKEEMMQLLRDHYAEILPVSTHEKDEWKLTPGGWAWVKSDPWSDVPTKRD